MKGQGHFPSFPRVRVGVTSQLSLAALNFNINDSTFHLYNYIVIYD